MATSIRITCSSHLTSLLKVICTLVSNSEFLRYLLLYLIRHDLCIQGHSLLAEVNTELLPGFMLAIPRNPVQVFTASSSS